MVNKQAAKRLTIGVLLSWIHDDYHISIWKTIADKAARYNVNLLLFVGGTPNLPNHARGSGSSIYDLVNRNVIDGLIILAAALDHYASHEKIRDFCDKYREIPVVCLGTVIEGLVSVVIDNEGGMYELVKHLIEVHDITRFVFISGPGQSQESGLRYRGFRRALQESRLSIGDEFILEGDFTQRGSGGLIEKLFLEKKGDFQAIVCANDAMALGIMNYLKLTGCSVPGDFVITGFDDLPGVKYLYPPLTTVCQPTRELGEAACELLLALIRGENVPDKLYLPAPLNIRQSCGCLSVSVTQEGSEDSPFYIQPKADRKVAASQKELIGDILQDWKIQEPGSEIVGNWLKLFLTRLDRYLKGQTKVNAVIYSLTDTLLEKFDETTSGVIWPQLLNDVKNRLLVQPAYCRYKLELREVFRKLMVHLSELLLRPYPFKPMYHHESGIDVNAINYKIMSTFDIPTLSERIISELSKLRIYSCYISEYKGAVHELDSVSYFIPMWSQPVLIFREHEIIKPLAEGGEFLTRLIIPGSYLPAGQYAMFIMPLLFNDFSFGYIAFQLSDCDPFIYEALQCTIGNAIIGAHNVEELKRTKALAESANRIKGEFLANMSHEIRTPLNSILGFTDLLMEDASDSAFLDKLKIVNKAGKNLLNIINDILDFSRIEAGKMEFHNDIFSLFRFFIDMKDMFSIKAGKQNLFFKIDLDSSVPEFVTGDEQRINQIMINLLGNAFKFTESGEISVECYYENSILSVKVADTGIGIPRDKIDSIFSLFNQVDSSATRKYGGTGLGLAITNKLVEKMGGEIRVTSEVGKGSVFIFWLPLPVAGQETETEREDSWLATNRSASGSSGFSPDYPVDPEEDFSVLVAEDDEINRRLFGVLLAKMKVKHQFAANGRQALAQLSAGQFDLLLLDMQMPVMDGMALLEKIRLDKKLADLYVIAVTAHTLKGDRQKYLAAGCNDYLPKPLDKDIFRDKIIQLLQNKQQIVTAGIMGAVDSEKVFGAAASEKKMPVLSSLQLQTLRLITLQLKQCQRIFDPEQISQLAGNLVTAIPTRFIRAILTGLNQAVENADSSAIGDAVRQLEILSDRQGEEPHDC